MTPHDAPLAAGRDAGVPRAVMDAAFAVAEIATAINDARFDLIRGFEDTSRRHVRKGLRELRDARARLDALIGELEREG